jgi:hypothetical protein
MSSKAEKLKYLKSDLERLESRITSLGSQLGEYHHLYSSAEEKYHELEELRYRFEDVIAEIRRRRDEIRYELGQATEALRAIRNSATEVDQLITRESLQPQLRIAPIPGFPDPKNKAELRRWWHEILRNHGRYACFAVFLVLPSDKEAIRYSTEFSRELHLITGDNCLVLGIGETELTYFGFDEQLWRIAIEEQVFEGHSIKVAQLFNISIADFPCLILFRDIRSSEHLIVSFKSMNAESIAELMKELFSIVNTALAEKEDPLKMIEQRRNNEQFRKKGSSIITGLRNIAGKTFETALEATISAIIK